MPKKTTAVPDVDIDHVQKILGSIRVGAKRISESTEDELLLKDAKRILKSSGEALGIIAAWTEKA